MIGYISLGVDVMMPMGPEGVSSMESRREVPAVDAGCMAVRRCAAAATGTGGVREAAGPRGAIASTTGTAARAIARVNAAVVGGFGRVEALGEVVLVAVEETRRARRCSPGRNHRGRGPSGSPTAAPGRGTRPWHGDRSRPRRGDAPRPSHRRRTLSHRAARDRAGVLGLLFIVCDRRAAAGFPAARSGRRTMQGNDPVRGDASARGGRAHGRRFPRGAVKICGASLRKIAAQLQNRPKEKWYFYQFFPGCESEVFGKSKESHK